MTSPDVALADVSNPETNIENRDRQDLCCAGVLGLFQAVVTAFWAADIGPNWQWFGGAVIEFALTSYFAFCLLQLQNKFCISLPLVVIILLLPTTIGMAKYQYLMDPAGFGDLFQLPNLVLHYGVYGWAGVLAALASVCGWGFAYLKNFRPPSRNSLVLWILPIGFWCVVAAKLLLPPALASSLPAAPPLERDHVAFPTPVLYGNWGAFLRSALVYGDRAATIARLRNSAQPDFGFLDKALVDPERRNIYFIVLESFMDPNAIAGAAYSGDPLAPLFREWRSTSGLTAMSPVFGGRSAESEFEAYCGLSVTFEGAPVVFPQLQPDGIDCLPRKLANLGWHTETRTIADPHLFDYGATYPKIGFQTLYFADSVGTDDMDDITMPSAQAVLGAHLRHIDQLLADGRPFLTSVFGTFGHLPYPLDEKRRPFVISTNSRSHDLLGYINSIHYTSEAVGKYIEDIRQKDPNALVVAFGDHHPILRDLESTIDYPGPTIARQDVPLLIIDGPRGFVPLHGRVPLFSVPDIVSDILTKGAFCQSNSCAIESGSVRRPLPQALLASDRQTNRIVDCLSAPTDQLCDGASAQMVRYQAALATLLGNE